MVGHCSGWLLALSPDPEGESVAAVRSTPVPTATEYVVATQSPTPLATAIPTPEATAVPTPTPTPEPVATPSATPAEGPIAPMPESYCPAGTHHVNKTNSNGITRYNFHVDHCTGTGQNKLVVLSSFDFFIYTYERYSDRTEIVPVSEDWTEIRCNQQPFDTGCGLAARYPEFYWYHTQLEPFGERCQARYYNIAQGLVVRTQGADVNSLADTKRLLTEGAWDTVDRCIDYPDFYNAPVSYE